MAVYPFIVSATGFVRDRTPGSEEIVLMVLYENKQNNGWARFLPFKHDVLCYYLSQNILDICAPLTKWNLKAKETLSVLGQGLFNWGCVQSFACTATGCGACPKYDTSYVSYLTEIPIRAGDTRTPGVPPGLAVIPGNGALTISWQPATGTDVFAYAVNVLQGTTPVVSGYTEDTLRSVTIGNLTNGVAYSVEVMAVSHNNIFGQKATATGTPVGATNPLVYDIQTTPVSPKAGDSITITASLANTGPNGNVRSVFKVDGVQISDQNSTLKTFPEGGLWKPTAPYTMPNKTITIAVEAYGWNGSKWVLTDTNSITRTPSAPICTGVTLAPFSASIKEGETVTFTASVTPSTSPFLVQFKDRAGTLLGTCTTTGESCTFVWDSTGKSPGTYYVKAHVVEGGCQSTESVIEVSPVIRQWNMNIYVRDSLTNNPVDGATITAGTQSKATDATGLAQFRVNEGSMDINISKIGYNTFSTVESVFSDKTFNYVLAPIGSGTGNIKFVTVPSDADIYLDGNPQGVKTPVTITNIPAGEHMFTLKLAGYNDLSGKVVVSGGTTLEVYAVLTSTTTDTGALYINSIPGGADVIVDGQSQKVQTPTTITNLTAGKHEVKLTKAGYQDFTATVTITAGTTSYLSATLTVLPEIGALEISTTPAGARLFIDGADTEKITPATITSLASGEHTYRLVLSGYQDATGKFTIEPAKTTTVDVTLTKAAKGAGAGTVIGIGLLAAGVLGAVVYSSRKKKPPTAREYLKYPL